MVIPEEIFRAKFQILDILPEHVSAVLGKTARNTFTMTITVKGDVDEMLEFVPKISSLVNVPSNLKFIVKSLNQD